MFVFTGVKVVEVDILRTLGGNVDGDRNRAVLQVCAVGFMFYIIGGRGNDDCTEEKEMAIIYSVVAM